MTELEGDSIKGLLTTGEMQEYRAPAIEPGWIGRLLEATRPRLPHGARARIVHRRIAALREFHEPRLNNPRVRRIRCPQCGHVRHTLWGCEAYTGYDHLFGFYECGCDYHPTVKQVRERARRSSPVRSRPRVAGQ